MRHALTALSSASPALSSITQRNPATKASATARRKVSAVAAYLISLGGGKPQDGW